MRQSMQVVLVLWIMTHTHHISEIKRRVCYEHQTTQEQNARETGFQLRGVRLLWRTDAIGRKKSPRTCHVHFVTLSPDQGSHTHQLLPHPIQGRLHHTNNPLPVQCPVKADTL